MDIREDDIIEHCLDSRDLGLKVYANLIYLRSDIGRLLDIIRDLEQKNESLREELNRHKTIEKIMHSLE